MFVPASSSYSSSSSSSELSSGSLNSQVASPSSSSSVSVHSLYTHISTRASHIPANISRGSANGLSVLPDSASSAALIPFASSSSSSSSSSYSSISTLSLSRSSLFSSSSASSRSSPWTVTFAPSPPSKPKSFARVRREAIHSGFFLSCTNSLTAQKGTGLNGLVRDLRHFTLNHFLFHLVWLLVQPNLGNTCFMNSMLQCLFATPPLVDYFLRNRHLVDLSTTNPLSSHGNIAREVSILLMLVLFVFFQIIRFTFPSCAVRCSASQSVGKQRSEDKHCASSPLSFLAQISHW